MKTFSDPVAAPWNGRENTAPKGERPRQTQEECPNEICRSSASFSAYGFSPFPTFISYEEHNETLISDARRHRRALLRHRRRALLRHRRHALRRHPCWHFRVTNNSLPVRLSRSH